MPIRPSDRPAITPFKNAQILAMVLATLIFTAGGIYALRTLHQFSQSLALHDQQEGLIDRINALLSHVKDVETARRGYLLTGDIAYVQPYDMALPRIYALIDFARADAKAGLIEPAAWEEAERLLMERIRLAEDSIARFRVNPEVDQIQRDISDQGKAAMDRLRQQLQSILDAEQEVHDKAVLALHAEENNALRYIAVGVLVSVLLMLFALALLWWQVVYRTRAEHTAQIASDQLESVVDELRLRNQLIVGLGDLSHSLQAAASYAEALNILSQAIPTIFWGTRGALYLTRESRDHLEAGAIWGDGFKSPAVVAPEDCWALRKGKVHTVNAGERAFLCPHTQAETSGHTLCIPLMAQGESRGFLHLDYPESTASNQSQREFAESCAEQFIVALTNLQLRDRLRTQAIRDPLTGLFNRRYMLETADRELARARRESNSPVSLLMLDIDHFKRFNDTFGHDAGDHVIQMVAEHLKRFVRGADVAARYGGEEFVLLLPGAARQDAANRADALRQRVEALQPTHAGQTLQPITLSIGVAAFPSDGESVDALLKAADLALYEAKRQGRNRVVAATEAPPPAGEGQA